MGIIDRYVKPHKKIAREVEAQHFELVIKEAPVLHQLCHTKRGLYQNALAMAHPQIESRNPLRFFVTAEGEIIINPKIVRHTQTSVDSSEGCFSFPDKPRVIVQRWHKCEVEFTKLGLGFSQEDWALAIKGEGFCLEPLSGKRAFMFQHEIDHLNGGYIYEL